MSDRLAVMSHGKIVQLGTPEHVYNEPVDAYVADFLGVSNLMDATVDAPGGSTAPCRVRLGDFLLDANVGDLSATGNVKLAIRPERVHLHPHGSTGPNRMPGMVERLVFLGSTTQIFVRLANGAALQTLERNDGEALSYTQGSPVSIALPADALRVLPDPGVSISDIHEETLSDVPPELAEDPSSTARARTRA